MSKSQLVCSREPIKLPKHWRIQPLLIFLFLLFILVEKLKRPVFDPSSFPYYASNLDQCSLLYTKPHFPKEFHSRTKSDRFVEGTPDFLIHNAKIWLGGTKEEVEVLNGGMLWLGGGIIKKVWKSSNSSEATEFLESVSMKEIQVIDAEGKWLTPGLFDLHSHVGVMPSLGLQANDDLNSVLSPVSPFLRILDGIDNTMDEKQKTVPLGGVTAGLVLPGSANSLGGQAYLLKWLKQPLNTPQSMLLEPPLNLPPSGSQRNLSKETGGIGLPWRHMKFACGENPSRFYGMTRMDAIWGLRKAFDEASKILQQQQEFCTVLQTSPSSISPSAKFPTAPLEIEALVDVLLGKVKVNTHCYEVVDFDDFIRLSNEYKFPVAAFHHAHEAWMIPERLKETWGGTPAIAGFSNFARYKREAYLFSDFWPKILNDNDIPVVLKSDDPGVDARYLIGEAAAAHHFGLPENIALASVITNPAVAAGVDHRLGYVKAGYDADVVLWDSHPLSLGALPTQVFIDGVPQYDFSSTTTYHPSKIPTDVIEVAPLSAKWNSYEMLSPPSWERQMKRNVGITGIKEIYYWAEDGHIRSLKANVNGKFLSILILDNKIKCIGECESDITKSKKELENLVNLSGGTLIPPISVFGSSLGLANIQLSEPSTQDGYILDDLSHSMTLSQRWLPLAEGVVRAKDGLGFGGEALRATYESGVGRMVVHPMNTGFFGGISVAYRVGAENSFAKGAILKDQVASHFTISRGGSISVSTQIAALRQMLKQGVLNSLEKSNDLTFDKEDWLSQIVTGQLPIVIKVNSADTMLTLIQLKSDIEDLYFQSFALGDNQESDYKGINMIFYGAQEAHLIAEQISDSGVHVILPVGPSQGSWEERRHLLGPPINDMSLPVYLASKNVTFALGAGWQDSVVQTMLWRAGFEVKTSKGRVSREEGLEWICGNTERILNIHRALMTGLIEGDEAEFVALDGDVFEYGTKIVAISDGLGGVDFLHH